MTNAVMLDNVTHKDLRVRTGYSAEFGDNINLAPVFLTEFAFVQREYPILFQKDSNGDFESVALLGLDKGENLFLGESGWNARYVPAVQQRGPFLIGIHQDRPEVSVNRGPMIHLNLDNPRISESEGEAVFMPHGGNSPFLEHVTRMLQIIFDGAELAKPMFAAFEEAGLIEAVEMKINLDENTQYKLPDFFTISQDRLEALEGTVLERLNRQGYLQLAMFVANSLGNIEWILELKNRRRAADQA
jgi:hypothetical protein